MLNYFSFLIFFFVVWCSSLTSDQLETSYPCTDYCVKDFGSCSDVCEDSVFV
jgi:hypothetical protein